MPEKRDIEKVTADFREAMLDKLRENEHKKHWNEASITYLRVRLSKELRELDVDLSQLNNHPDLAIPSAMKECADVANFAMMIYDNLRNGIIDGSTDSEYLEGES